MGKIGEVGYICFVLRARCIITFICYQGVDLKRPEFKFWCLVVFQSLSGGFRYITGVRQITLGSVPRIFFISVALAWPKNIVRYTEDVIVNFYIVVPQ